MRRALLGLALLLAALVAAPAAHAQDPCDTNPDDPSCDGTADLIVTVPASPAQCPAGGLVVVILGVPQSPPICSGTPGATGATGAPGAQGIPGQAGAPSFVPATVQDPSCVSRRMFDVTIPQRFAWGSRVWVNVGGHLSLVFVRHNHRIRLAFQGRPCGLYGVVVYKRHVHPFRRLYVMGAGGSLRGFNVR